MQRDWFMYPLRSTYKNRLEYPFNRTIYSGSLSAPKFFILNRGVATCIRGGGGYVPPNTQIPSAPGAPTKIILNVKQIDKGKLLNPRKRKATPAPVPWLKNPSYATAFKNNFQILMKTIINNYIFIVNWLVVW